MRLKLEVLASTAIKRKKPWPEFAWLGQETETLFMIDDHRLSVLYLPSGKTKRKIPKLHQLFTEVAVTSHSKNGALLIGLLHSGDLFLWWKDQDLLKIIHGLPNLMYSSADKNRGMSRPKIYISNDGASILVLINNVEIYMWRKVPTSEDATKEKGNLSGTWTKVNIPDHINKWQPGYKETCVTGAFYNNQVLGRCCLLTFTFYVKSYLTIVTVLIKSIDTYNAALTNRAGYTVEWSELVYPIEDISRGSTALRSRGAIVAAYGNQCQVLSIALNQKQPQDSCVLYVSPLSSCVVVCDLKNCGQKDCNKYGRAYWIIDVKWLCDDLFVACMTKQGSLCILSKLGEPVIIQTVGCSVELGPQFFLPLHPLITVINSKDKKVLPNISTDSNITSTVSEVDMMRQRFSITVHPHYPAFLCSDGYMVTVLVFPDDIHPMSMMTSYVAQANHCLDKIKHNKNLELSLVDTLKFTDIPDLDTSLRSIASSNQRSAHSLKAADRFRLEDVNGTMSSTVDSIALETSGYNGPINQFGIADLESGKIFFGDENFGMLDDEDVDHLDPLKKAQVALFNSWALAVTEMTPWNAEMEKLTQYTIRLIVKMFAVTLYQDSDKVTDTVSVEERLLLVFSLYRAVLYMTNFDLVQQNLIPIVLRFVTSVIDLILNDKNIRKSISRTDILNSGFMMLLFTEQEYSKIYTLLNDISTVTVPSSDVFSQAIFVNFDENESLLSKRFKNGILSCRLSHAWAKLYKHIARHYKLSMKVEKSIPKLLTKILCMTQTKLQSLKCGKPQPVKFKLNHGDEMYLDGSWYFAIHIWKERFKDLNERKLRGPKAVKLLHAILYTSLQSGELRFVIEMANTLLSSITDGNHVANDHDNYFLHNFFLHTSDNNNQANRIQLPSTEYSSARKVIQTIARFMASYFSNQLLYIYPPHAVKPLPSLLKPVHHTDRILPVYHEALATIIRQENLEELWTLDRVLEYLLISGLLPEAVWFAHKMGDWKSAFILSVACQERQKSATQLYGRKLKSLYVPEELTPVALLQVKLEKLLVVQTINPADDSNKLGARVIKRSASLGSLQMEDENNIDQITKSVTEILTAATISCADITAWLLHSLVQQLKALTKQFTAFIPQGFYLPAPPLFCPQPTTTNEEHWSTDVEEEHSARMKVASLVQLILVILKASRTALPAVYWYTQQLCDVHRKAEPFRNLATSTTANLENVFRQFRDESCLSSNLDDPSVNTVLTSFRDFCTILWMIHARDKMNLSLRQKAAVLKGTDVLEGRDQLLEDDQWLSSCYTSLQWTIHMIPFMEFWETSRSGVYEVLLSQLVEFPANQESADILLEFFHDESILDPDVQEKSERLLKDWQGMFIGEHSEIRSPHDSPKKGNKADRLKRLSKYPGKTTRGKTLSSYFHQHSRHFDKILLEREKVFGKYDQFIFSESETGDLIVGARPCEADGLFVEFLDTMFDIVFTRVNEESVLLSTEKSWPLLPQFVMELRQRELSSLSFRIVTTLQHNSNLTTFSGKNSLHLPNKTPPSSPRKPYSESPRSPRRQLVRRHSVESPIVTPILKKMSHSQDSLDNIAQPVKRPQRSVSFSHERTHYFGHYPLRQRSSSLVSISQMSNESSSVADPEPSPRPLSLRDKRSLSLSDLRTRVSANPETAPLTSEVPFSVFLAYRINLGEQFQQISRLLEWLTRWGGKHHILHNIGFVLDSNQPTIRVKVHPYLILLSLWLIENKYEKLPVLDSSKKKQKLAERSPKLQKPPSSPRDSPARKIRPVSDSESPIKIEIQDKQSKDINFNQNAKNNEAKLLAKESFINTESKNVEIDKRKNKHRKNGEMKNKKRTKKGDVVDGRMGSADNKSRSRAFMSKMSMHQRFKKMNDDDNSVSDLSRISERASEVDHNSFIRRSESSSLVVPRLPLSSEDDSDCLKSESLKVEELQCVSRSANLEQTTPTEYHTDTDNMTDLGQHLSNVIRSELRRIVEIQHKSVLAMLGAVDDSSMPVEHPRNQSVSARSSRNNLSYIQSAGTQTTLTLKESTQATKGTETQSEARRRHRKNPDADFDVSSLSQVSETENKKLQKQKSRGNVKSKGTNTMSSSGIKCDNLDVKKVEFDLPENDLTIRRINHSSVNSALNELHVLTEQVIPNIYPNTQNPVPTIPLLRIENRDHILPRNFGHQKSSAVTFPPVPLQAWNKQSVSHNENYPPRLPLTQQFQGHQSHQPSITGIPFPLLHIQTQSQRQPFSYIPQRQPFSYIPQLHTVAPTPVAAYQVRGVEQIKHEQLQQFHEKARAGQQAQQLQRFGINLLHIDFNKVQEKYQPSTRSLFRENFRHQDQQTDTSVVSKPTRPQVVGTDQSQQMPSSPDHVPSSASSKQSSVRSSPRKIRTVAMTTEVKDTEIQYDIDSFKPHHGYAITPGSFDVYLHSDEAKNAPESKTKVVYDVLVKGERTSPKKVEFATTTTDLEDHIRQLKPSPWRQLTDYMSAVHDGTNVMAPDILFDLRYGDNETQAGQGRGNDGRSYLNVVDLEPGIMDDIFASLPQRRKTLENSTGSPSKVTFVEKGESPIHAVHNDNDEEYKSTADATTVKLFSDKTDKQFADQILSGQATRNKSKRSIVRKLQEMNEQINAIDEMSRNIEDEYDDTKLLLHTIENLNDAIAPGDSYYPRASVAVASPNQSLEKTSLKSSYETRKVISPQKSDGVPSTKHSPVAMERDLHISGLSGVSDIIGEVLARGDIDVHDVGLTDNEAKRLVERAKQLSARDNVPETELSIDQLQEVFNQTPRPHDGKTRNKKELTEWMNKQRSDRQDAYMQNLRELREAERNPYKSEEKNIETGNFKEIQALDKKREEERKTRLQNDNDRRKLQATMLMADILHDKPDVPTAFQSRPRLIVSPPPTQQIQHKLSQQPRQTVQHTSPRTRSRQRASKRTDVVTRSGVDYDPDWTHVSSYKQKHDDRRVPDHKYPHLTEDVLRSYNNDDVSSIYTDEPDTARALASYTRKIEVMDQSEDESRLPSNRTESEPRDNFDEAPLGKSYQPRPFTTKVKLQRPEITRRRGGKTQTYGERLAQMNKGPEDKSRPSTIQEKQKIYGSKRIPGLASTFDKQQQRPVKTYTERLQEMKNSTYTKPIVKTDRAVPQNYMNTIKKPVMKAKPPPNRAAVLPEQTIDRAETSRDTFRISVPSVTRRLPRKPMTYVQQLQQLQAAAPKPKHRSAYGAKPKKMYHTPPLRSSIRARPYRDPYAGLDQSNADDVMSDISPLSMDEAVHRILYGDDDSITLGAEAMHDDFDDSYLYTSLVDIHDLVEVASVSEGSIMSVIDWDAVDKLIADVE